MNLVDKQRKVFEQEKESLRKKIIEDLEQWWIDNNIAIQKAHDIYFEHITKIINEIFRVKDNDRGN